MTADYNEVIQRVLRDEIYDSVFKKNIDALRALFPREGVVGGDRITEKFEVARSSPAAAYTKADVNPSAASNTLIKPWWTKVQYHTAAEVSGIDISNAQNGGTDIDLIKREISQETKSLWNIIFASMMTQIKADVDDASAYSDKGESRATYPVLASYKEDTPAAISLDYMRGMQNTTTLLKNCGPLSGYACLMEQNVYNTFNPLAAALHTFNAVTKSDEAIDMGYPDCKNFEGLDIVDPREVPGMTAGDTFMLRKQDVLFNDHRPLEIVQVPSGRDSVMFVIRVGINLHVVQPGFQAKMTNKT